MKKAPWSSAKNNALSVLACILSQTELLWWNGTVSYNCSYIPNELWHKASHWRLSSQRRILAHAQSQSDISWQDVSWLILRRRPQPTSGHVDGRRVLREPQHRPLNTCGHFGHFTTFSRGLPPRGLQEAKDPTTMNLARSAKLP